MKRHIDFFFGFILLIIISTFPLCLKFTTCIPGFFSTDEPFGALWNSWRISYSFQHGLSLKTTNLIAYPFGVNIYASGYFSSIWFIIGHFLSIVTTMVLTHNIQIFLNIFLSSVFTFLLVFYLTENSLCAFSSSIIFSFCPYQFARIWQHLGLSYNQWLPFSLFALILLRENQNKKRAVLLLISIFLLLSFDYSIMYLGMITLTSFFIYLLGYHMLEYIHQIWGKEYQIQQEKSYAIVKFFNQQLTNDLYFIKKTIFVGIAALIILMPQFFFVLKNRMTLSTATPASAFNPYHRQFEDLFSQSARPLSYFILAAAHPLFGKFTENFIGTKLYGESFTEHTLYLGWTPLILAFFAIKRWRKDRKKSQSHNITSSISPGDGSQEPEKDNFYIGFFIFLAVVAWLFSQPPWWNIFGIKLYMPSFFMYKILPMYRAYCRFGIVVMLAVAVLAGFGLKFILEKFKSQKIKITISMLFCGLVLFEFWNYPPYKVIDVSKVPAVYYWLKEQPGDFAIAEYPLDYDSPNEIYKFYQTTHEKKIINGTIPGTYANKIAGTITKLSEPRTTGILKWMEVKYVIVHKQKYLDTELTENKEELAKISKNTGLKFVTSFPSQKCYPKNIMCVQKTGPIEVYEVISPPQEPEVINK